VPSHERRQPRMGASGVREDDVRHADDGEADQRREHRDRGDAIRLLQLTEIPVGDTWPSSRRSETQPNDPSEQTPEDARYAEEHEGGHHQQTGFPSP
jgi:hypothetical protein